MVFRRLGMKVAQHGFWSRWAADFSLPLISKQRSLREICQRVFVQLGTDGESQEDSARNFLWAAAAAAILHCSPSLSLPPTPPALPSLTHACLSGRSSYGVA